MMELLFDANSDNRPEIRFVTSEQAHGTTGLTPREFSGAPDAVRIVMENGHAVAWTGLGNAGSVKENTVRRAAAVASRELAGMGYRSLSAAAGHYGSFAKAVAEGVGIGAYHFNPFKTKDREETLVESLRITDLDAQEQKWAHAGAVVAQAVNRARDYGNTPPNMMVPASLAEVAEDYVRRTGSTLTVMDEFELKDKGFGGLLAVGAGSANPPRFIILEREVDPKWPTVALVGKTITFDSGGLSLKTAKDMPEEKLDKMGGIAALGIMETVAALQIPVNLIVALCVAENMPGGTATRPGDVITIYGGTSVEIIDTDAEGRLVLADGLAYVAEKFKPDLTIDIATLTGACCVALGMERAGLFTGDDELADVFYHAGESSGDRCWRLPLGEEFSRDMESRIADLKNLGSSRYGGASKAAAFLESFKGDGRWTHLDIAGTGMPDEDRPGMERGATGAGIRLVTEALRRMYPVQ
jgi:leucyl aminopeptidase